MSVKLCRVILLLFFVASYSQAEVTFTNQVVLRGLNKITANVSIIKIPVETSFVFGNLEIRPRLCWRSPPEEPMESKALLEIYDIQDFYKMVFFGWMIASNPGVSALENSVYDISLIECSYTENK